MIRIVGSTILAAAVCGGAPAAAASLDELVNKREWWPPEVTVLAAAQFQNGKSVRKGQTVLLAEVRPDGLKLDDGSMYFVFDPAKTDFHERLERRLAALTPEQKALTLTEVLRRQELWPVRVALRSPVLMEGIPDYPAGLEMVLLRTNPDGTLQLASPERNSMIPVDPWSTDFFDRARDRLPVAVGDTAPFAMRSLESMLEPSADGEHVWERDYIVVYQGRDACPRATHYGPDLAAMLERLPDDGPDWELVFPNAIDSPELNRIHHANMGLNGRASLENYGNSIVQVLSLPTSMTPWVILMDRNGKTLVSVSEDGTSFPPDRVIETIERTLGGH